jgi:hypothetical protein
VRTDISLAQQIVQSNHATFEMASRLSERTETPSVVLIGVPDKSELEAVIERLQRYGIDYEAFYEPDNDLGLTAVSTYPIQNKKQRKAMGTYRLWSPEVCYAAA